MKDPLTTARVIAIDDDPVNNTINKLTIEMVRPSTDIVTFTNPAKGFEFIREEYVNQHCERPAVLFLDLNMPVMSGWEFLERFNEFPDYAKKLIRIFILSSSVDDRDRQRSYTNKNVADFIVKPLVKDNILEIFG